MPPNDDAHHTPKCNALKAEIEQLARGVKLAQLQPHMPDEPPPFELQSEQS